jgi:alpha-L-rhamnosidase
VTLEPHFVKNLDHFEAKHDGPYGEIVSSWEKDDEKILYDITIPANSSATVLFEGISVSGIREELVGKQENGMLKIDLESGSYDLVIESLK